MTLPAGFSEFEFLQDLIRKWHNRIVREEFQDLGGENWDPDITVSRGAVRHACTWKDTDTAEMGIMRLFLYYFVHRKAQDLQQPVYGIPVQDIQSARKFRPQIFLYFIEDEVDVEPGFAAIDGQITFRIMDEESETITQAKVETLANRIRSAFGSRNGFVWRKGKVMCSYTDWQRGYQLQLQTRDEAEGRRIAEQVLDIQGHTPNWKYFNGNNNAEPTQAYPTLPGTVHILGENYRLPRKRAIADVRFQYALLHLYGKPQPLCLVDRTYAWKNAIARA